MSMSRGCLVIERRPGQWFCVVASTEYDFDFTGRFAVYGPSPCADDAFDAMHAHECNPGSYTTIPLEEVSERHKEMVDNGPRRGAAVVRRPPGRFFI